MTLSSHCRCAVLLSGILLLVACGSSEPSGESTVAPPPAKADVRPNILLIVADDLGYSDVGAFGGEIPTPRLDELAHSGLMLTQFYANVTCSPTRAMLMSGMDNHLAGLGVMGPPANEEQRGKPGYEGHLNFRVASLADLMRDAGYHTYMTGKWHLGRTKETGPHARGFEQAFASLDGAAHLGGLSWNGPGKAQYFDGDELVTVDDDFYTTRFYTERMIDYIERGRGDGKPFFAWLAYTAPHWPLQAPKESIAKFKGQYDDGYEALYQRRLERTKELGLIARDYTPVPPVAGQPKWEDLSEEERRSEARKMEIYAAMVSDLDTYVGKVIDYLKSTGQYDNTVIVFLSDNGAEGLRRDAMEPLKSWVEKCCDNSYENLGAGNSYVMYGPNWARAGAVPFRRSKGTAFDGGFHVPAFVHYPQAVAKGARSAALGTVMDLLPTFLDIAGTTHPGTSYRGQPVLPAQGKSLWPLFTGRVEKVHQDDEAIGWELYGQRTIRQGDWKIVWDAAERDEAHWQLFNLARDPSEQTDLSQQEPERLQAMIALWDTYHRDNGLVP